MATVKESWQSLDTQLAMADYGADQTWVAESDYTLTELRVRMSNSSSAYSGNIIIDLYSVSESKPNTLIANLINEDISIWGTIPTWRIFTGLSQAITNGVEYAYVVNLNPARDATHYITWSGKAGYAGGIGYQEHTDEVYTNAGIDWHFVNLGDAGGVPTKAENPTPADTDTDVDFSNLTLSWEDGGGADTYNVYVGDASDNLTLLSSAQAGVSFVLSVAQRALFTDTCWWRIDATNVIGTTTGDDWSFTVAAPGKATTPTPTDDEEDIKLTGINQLKKLQWEAPA